VILIFSFAFGAMIFIIIRVIILLFMSLRTAKIAHDSILKKVFQGPINLFFDVTPVGKILNRFSKDMMVLDNRLCFNIGSFFSRFYQALAALFVAALAVRWILVAILIFIMFGFCLFRYVLRAYKETNRVESVTKSPTLSFLQETQSGSTVIRAFKRE
jgi:ABC-type multidrug transport system fused ATPase/permease subunit